MKKHTQTLKAQDLETGAASYRHSKPSFFFFSYSQVCQLKEGNTSLWLQHHVLFGVTASPPPKLTCAGTVTASQSHKGAGHFRFHYTDSKQT